MEFINLKYDLTPSKYISMVVNEIDKIAAHSVPVIISEIIFSSQNEHLAHSDSSSSEEDSEEKDPQFLVPGFEGSLSFPSQEDIQENLETPARLKNRLALQSVMEMEDAGDSEDYN